MWSGKKLSNVPSTILVSRGNYEWEKGESEQDELSITF